jgi:hypothetical protein
MKLDCVLTACNLNPLYCDFIPLFIKTWNKLYPDVDVKIVLISENIPENLKMYEQNIILFKPILNISTAFISQYIRLLYPAILNYTNGVMITDIDMLPMNNTYYSKHIEDYDNNKFIYLRDVLIHTDNQIAMCYNVATSKTWQDIFHIHSIQDINTSLINRFKSIDFVEGTSNSCWFTDQIELYNHVQSWNERTHNFVYLNDKITGYSRLDRIHMNTHTLDETLKTKIKSGVFSDYHCLRPYSQYKNMNDMIYHTL